MCRNRKQQLSPDKPAQIEPLRVQYLGRLQIAVSGTFTGNLYRFSPFDSVQPVDPRDAFYLLSSGLFGVAH
jgi:hypothetical protein